MSVSTAFVVATVALLVLVVVMAVATTRALTPRSDEQSDSSPPGTPDDASSGPADEPTAATHEAPVEAEPTEVGPPAHPARDGEQNDPPLDSPRTEATRSETGDQQASRPSIDELSTTMLFANVLGTHGLFAVFLLGVALWTGVSWDALGIGAPTIDAGSGSLVGLGIGLGVALYVGNELLAVNLDRIDVAYSESLREGLAPETAGGWAVLLLVVLPVVAGFEELLFRAAAIGGLAVGLSLSPWLLLVVSTVAFALGHGIQGPGGVLVTGLLGGLLGVVFVLTNSLLLVFVAHYVVNALEFVIHEGFDVDAEQWFAVDG